MRVVKCQNRLPREVAETSFLKTFKVKLGGALGSLIWPEMSLLTARGMEMTFRGHFQPCVLCDSLILVCLQDLNCAL